MLKWKFQPPLTRIAVRIHHVVILATLTLSLSPFAVTQVCCRTRRYKWLPFLQICRHHCWPKEENVLSGTSKASLLLLVQNRVGFVVKASGESSESSTSITFVKSVQNVWDKSEDRLGLIGLGFAAVVAIWASANLITAVDKLPLIPSALELIGILFSSWFVYRYLLFKPDREELFQIFSKSISDVLGQ
ncbi:hypothetical protein L6164_021526 [Bauhinia variegata]|uniref:Uncharacterized protein n=1 Tax=Bauhinia variegata TaxID=167791 RepID=A0ACB9MZU3_BAUVA|nr:hypothetical protein L6164_021526 [Bauhinia variegata]